MYAVVKPSRETIIDKETTMRHLLLPKAASAKSSYVDLPVKMVHLICCYKQIVSYE